jgi:hypothetical protein
MEETQKIFEPTQVTRDETVVHEPDATLVTPRFDEVEAQVARPVVPLAGRPARLGKSGGGRRQWPIALVLISALAGGVVSLLAFRLYQQRQQTQAVVTETGGQQTPTADASQSPEQAGASGATVATTEEQAQSGAPVVFEEFDPAKEGGAISDAAPTRPKATTEAVAAPAPARRDEAKEETREEAKPAPRAAEPKPRLVETIRPPRQVEARHEDARRSDDYRAEDEDFGDRRRERRRQRREQRREQRRNIDRIKDIFEGAPPS